MNLLFSELWDLSTRIQGICNLTQYHIIKSVNVTSVTYTSAYITMGEILVIHTRILISWCQLYDKYDVHVLQLIFYFVKFYVHLVLFTIKFTFIYLTTHTRNFTKVVYYVSKNNLEYITYFFSKLVITCTLTNGFSVIFPMYLHLKLLVNSN